MAPSVLVEGSIRFTKMSGGGNDFVVLEAPAARRLPALEETVRRICRRGMSVGADGLLVVDLDDPDEVRIAHYNADGGASPLCGNGSRCAARWARLRGRSEDPLRLRTAAGPLQATVDSDGAVTVRLGWEVPAPVERVLSLESGMAVTGYFVEVGVPHLVVLVEDPALAPVEQLGGALRRHPDLGEPGANVSFVSRGPAGPLGIRTYERGVEGETLACGTACLAAAMVAAMRSGRRPPVALRTRAASLLRADFLRQGGRFAGLSLTGEARMVYEGVLHPEAVQGGAGVAPPEERFA